MSSDYEKMLELNGYFKQSFSLLEKVINALKTSSGTIVRKKLLVEAIKSLISLSHTFRQENALLNQLRKLMMQYLFQYEKLVDNEREIITISEESAFIGYVMDDLATSARMAFQELLKLNISDVESSIIELKISLIVFYFKHAIAILKTPFWNQRLKQVSDLQNLAVDISETLNAKEFSALNRFKEKISLLEYILHFKKDNTYSPSQYLSKRTRLVGPDESKPVEGKISSNSAFKIQEKENLAGNSVALSNQQHPKMAIDIGSTISEMLLLKETLSDNWINSLIKTAALQPIFTLSSRRDIIVRLLQQYIESIGLGPNEYIYSFCIKILLSRWYSVDTSSLYDFYRSYDKTEIYQLILFYCLPDAAFSVADNHGPFSNLLEGPLEKKWTTSLQLLSKLLRKKDTPHPYSRILVSFIEIYLARATNGKEFAMKTFHGQRVQVMLDEFIFPHGGNFCDAFQWMDKRTLHSLIRLALLTSHQAIMSRDIISKDSFLVLYATQHASFSEIIKHISKTLPEGTQESSWYLLGLLMRTKRAPQILSSLPSDMRAKLKAFIEHHQSQQDAGKSPSLPLKPTGFFRSTLADFTRQAEYFKLFYPERII
jgi:hypothetical protein